MAEGTEIPRSVMSLRGVVPARGRTVTLDEMEEGIAKGAVAGAAIDATEPETHDWADSEPMGDPGFTQ